ncbi:Uncharacterised protein [Legionella beliardensis]|uniref:Uncharacterized protein n=1 Tax=Legionella beliardensis TaxID=91822 RepID=A0A378HZK8_9GAMM|nr:hypothetical protein [Legionella beliardensis]STX28182.1 Uncharacterised protein [Legionella beliardensis]
MTDFELDFLHTFYQRFLFVITPKELQAAIQHFQENKLNRQTDRYTGIHTFGLKAWKKQDAEKFTAAVAEALAQTTTQFMDTQAPETIYFITEKIRNKYIPKLVAELDPANPFTTLASQLDANLKKLTQQEKTSVFNGYSFFGGAAIIALGATVIYSNYTARH